MRFFAYAVFFAALFIDGATDCANAVTGAVSSGVLPLKNACRLSAVFSFLGCIIFCAYFPSVAENTAKAVTLPEGCAEGAVLSSLLSVAIWSGIAWFFSLPTSEGHGLIAAGAGAAAALGGYVDIPGFFAVLLAILPAALAGAFFSFILARILKNRKDGIFSVPIILESCLSSFFHGAQDGQKFIALALSASFIGEKTLFPTIISAAAFMALGTLFGGRIIKKMGEEMACADRTAALASDLGSTLCLGLMTAVGIPASTTHIKMTSLTAATKAVGRKTDLSSFLLLAGAWISTFPVCFVLSYLFATLFSLILL